MEGKVAESLEGAGGVGVEVEGGDVDVVGAGVECGGLVGRGDGGLRWEGGG